MITAKFSKLCKLSDVEVFTFQTYKQFFEWYINHQYKGAIYGVKDDGGTHET